jgi:hypothetical protein
MDKQQQSLPFVCLPSFHDKTDYEKDQPELIKKAIEISNGDALIALIYIVTCLAHEGINVEFEMIFTVPAFLLATIKLPIVECEQKNKLGYYVSWGDGNTTHNNNTHTFEPSPVIKQYRVRFFGMGIAGFCFNYDEEQDLGFSNLGFYNPDDVEDSDDDVYVEDNYFRECLTHVVSFGKLGCNFTSLENAFTMCQKNFSVPDYLPSNITHIHSMFYGCLLFNQPLNTWDVSNVLTIHNLFANCDNFNQPLRWNTSKIQDMSYMFQHCVSLNQDIQLDTSNVIRMEEMFYNCSIFNGKLEFNDTSNVNSMKRMFMRCEYFNQNLTGWNVQNVDDVLGMFARCNISKENTPLFKDIVYDEVEDE